MDGVLESYTALMVEEYADQPGNRGGAAHGGALQRHRRRSRPAGLADFCPRLRRRRGAAHARRLRPCPARANGRRDSRHRGRSSTSSCSTPTDARLCRAGRDRVDAADPLPGHDRRRRCLAAASRCGACGRDSFAWQTLRAGGCASSLWQRLARGADESVPLGFWDGMARQPWQPGDPVQRLPLEELIAGYTCDAAYAEFQEQQKGMVRVGMLADRCC